MELEDVFKDGEYSWESDLAPRGYLLAVSGLVSGFSHAGGVNGKVQKTLMERDDINFRKMDSGHEIRSEN